MSTVDREVNVQIVDAARSLGAKACDAFRHPGRIGSWLKRRTQLVTSSATSVLQVGVSAGLAWWIASTFLPWQEPLYAPIGAVVAIGVGENRMADRAFRLAAGMVVAVAVAGVIVNWAGTGTWQILVVTTLTTLLGRFMFDDTLARTYSAFHGAVIAATGVSRVIPEQLIEASLGAGVGILVVHVVFPPKMETAVLGSVEAAGDCARRALQKLGNALRTGETGELDDALEEARRVEAFVAPPDGRHRFGRQVTRLAPARWKDRSTAESFIDVEERLESLLLQMTSAVRMAGDAIVHDPRPRPDFSATVGELDSALSWMIRPPFDHESARRIAESVERAGNYLSSADISSDVDRQLHEELAALKGMIERTGRQATEGE